MRTACLLLLVTASAGAADLLKTPVAENWPLYHGDYTGHRYSALNQITPQNVGQLRAAWVFHSRSSNLLEGTPVVVNGLMFMTTANDAFALDARTGPITNGLIDDASASQPRGRIARNTALCGDQ